MVQECGWKNFAYWKLPIGLSTLYLLAYLFQHQEKINVKFCKRLNSSLANALFKVVT
jgi:hypothetical protein